MAEAHSTVEYREIPEFPGYRVGDDGSVWRRWVNCWWGRKLTDKWRQMKPSLNEKGYPYLNLVPPEGGSYRTFRVHRLVLTAFVGPCPEGMECRHLNGVRSDCRLSNLAWGTREENVEDRRIHANHGPRVRLYLHEGQSLPLKQWALKFGIGYSCLWHRINRLGMTFVDAISRPYLGTKSNGGHWNKLKREKRR